MIDRGRLIFIGPRSSSSEIPPQSPVFCFSRGQVYTLQMEMIMLVVFGGIGFWMWITTPEQRQIILGYLIAFSVVMYAYGLISGQAPGSHYTHSSE
jgi:hypothetical protein